MMPHACDAVRRAPDQAPLLGTGYTRFATRYAWRASAAGLAALSGSDEHVGRSDPMRADANQP
ncbi:hypothetical protein XabCFBP2524_12755 [Xanthomonas axonopodis pv. begoniae]|nr:hypothetical protein XabCFBP2524_12755 [Xanthomonas axonopodis pv. begoniae]